MLPLLLVSLIWAFSFGLIKRHLAGVDSTFVAATRLGLSLLVFLPFLRLRHLDARAIASLAGIGAIQFGVMYLAYIESFHFLQAYEAALFTITTPIFVTLFADALDRRFRPWALAAALLAVAGTAVVVLRATQLQLTLTGLLLVQLSNAAFAVGQVLYRQWRAARPEVPDHHVFALLYAGAFVIAGAGMATRDISVTLGNAQLLTLLYLGVLASGAGFFLWNLGATRVGTGQLAVMNNAKVPLGVTVALLCFGEQANLPALAASGVVLGAAVWLAGRPFSPSRSRR